MPATASRFLYIKQAAEKVIALFLKKLSTYNF